MTKATASCRKTRTDNSLLEIQDATVRFGNTTALDDVSFSVGINETVGLLGANGAGKTTLAKALIGYHQLTGGQILFQGERADFRSVSDARRRGIEMVFQDLSLARNLDTVCNFFIGKEIVRRVGPFAFRDRKTMRGVANECLHEIGLSEAVLRRNPVGTLSGGEQQLIAICRAGYFAEKLLILDEPFSALFDESVQLVLQVIRKAKDRGLSVVIITHHAPEVFDVADRFVVLQNGRIHAELQKDDTDIRELETLLIAHRWSAVKEMAAGVAHQIRNPLGVMKVAADMLRRTASTHSKTETELVEVLSNEIDNADRIILSFLEFAHQTKTVKELCSVNDLVQESVESISARLDTESTVTAVVEDPRARYILDKGLMKQAISNLVMNGLEASQNQARVEVRAEIHEDRLRIAVQDWGPGIDESVRTKIYDPFFTTRSSGTGLGLSIVHRIVELHGGKIEMDTSASVGTTFTLVL